MKRVTIKYTDGRETTYDTIKEASQNAGCNVQSLLRMACGGSTYTKRHLQIDSVSVEENKGNKNSHRRKGPHPLKCTNEQTGEVIETKTIREAQKLTGNEAHNLSYIINDGEYHWGWKYETINDDDVLDMFEFRDEVPDEVIALIYRYARAYVRKWHLCWDFAKEAIQHIACHVASAYSMGKAEKAYSLKKWVWMSCKYHGHEFLEKELRHHKICVEEPEDMKWDEVLGQNDDSIEMMQMFKDMPEELRPLAELYLNGNGSRMEVNTRLGIRDARRKELTSTLIKWLKDRSNV